MIDTAQDIPTYKKRLKKALENDFLRNALSAFATAYPQARKKALEGIDFEAIRDEIAAGKDESMARLEELFQEFKDRAEKNGAKVHLAKTAREANEIIERIANENGVKAVVKSKSMTAEETHLNDHLEAKGFKVTETDLGEWIIQLRHEGPSHMVMPAIHLSRAQVAQLFSEVTGESRDPDDIDGMVKVARKELRKAFIEADMGISGANFAIADSGAIGIISNEGNARLVTTLPRVHVALIGLDKLMPDLASALKILKVLPKNATGQLISSYVTWIAGTNECGGADDGKKQMHFVFLDNGRSELAKDPVFSEALRCVRCGACANVCPIYGLVGGHNYGHVYIGAIGLILTLFYHGRENARAIVKNCINCQACKAVCPGGIDLPYLIKKVYQKIIEEESKPVKNLLLSKVIKNRKLFHFLLRQAYLLQKPLARGEKVIRHLPTFFGKEHDFRSLPVIAATPFRDRFEQVRVNNPKYRVAFFGGCAMDFIYPEQGEAMLKVLESQQVDVDYPMGQTCCGLPVMMMGEEEAAREVALQNLEAFDFDRYDYVVTLCASCGSHLKENYPKLLKKGGRAPEKVERLEEKIIDFSSFMTDVLKASSDSFEKSGRKVAYHSPCHLCRGLGVTEAPRELLKTAGLQYTPSENEDVCCGFGGSYSVEFPELSSQILKKKLEKYKESGADYLVTDCPGCVLQLRGGAEHQKLGIEVKHIAEILAEEIKALHEKA